MVGPIRGYGPPGPRRASGPARGGFSIGGSRDAAGAAAVAPANLPALLALQELPDAAARDEAALRRGDGLLAAFHDVQRSLLSGDDATGVLTRLAALAQGDSGADAALRETIEALSLRARVLLAQHGR